MVGFLSFFFKVLLEQLLKFLLIRMNILQLEGIFEMQNKYLKHRTEIEIQNKEG